eukprot:Gregarina_sp_Poly_1__5365@NODE_2832_length_1656_cov_156_630585_g758_i3_p2_GENE_NODE_2832_length_1656_cov_156_630585_g758_i3NODE_2832_length_1656_cov_156_630585_g758_i3_p2_ORF_typecomplete_len141_score17_94_NODE_2832_length_1656_cov_156_630585_g758_i310561478
MLLTEFLTRDMVCRVNCITHDFCTKRIVLTILFLHLKYLQEKQTQLLKQPPPNRSSDRNDREITVGGLVADTEENASHMNPVAIEGMRNELRKPLQPDSPSEVNFQEANDELQSDSQSEAEHFSFTGQSTGDLDSRRISM